jgi:glycolate oxidase
VIRPGSERLEGYGQDRGHDGTFPPDCAVLCETADQVSAVLRLCREHRVPVTPRGAGSGMTGGALPIRGGVVLSTERMTRIREIDADDLVAVVEPGVITGDLQLAADDQGLFYPPDPASLSFCSIGGNVASNAGGPRAFKYGVTREYILGLEVALMGGEVLRCGRRTSKGVTGYDLVAGFVGSEGTFGVVTEITAKLLPRPAAVATLLSVYRDMAAAGRAVSSILHQGFRPRTLEIADRRSIAQLQGARYELPKDAGAITLIEIDGEPEGLEAAMIRVGQLCEDAGAVDVLVAQDESQRRSMWEARRVISPSLRAAYPVKVSEDICVPRGQLEEMLRRIDRLSAEHDLPIASFGHAGDGNLHVNMLSNGDPDDPAIHQRIEACATRLFEETIALRGTLSGEHGIGIAKQRFMPLEQSEAVLEWQRRWKRMWDPDELLNPGKILPPRPRGCTE